MFRACSPIRLQPFASSYLCTRVNLHCAAGRVQSMASTTSQPAVAVMYVTVPDRAVGKRLASGLVENHLAACVNIIPGVTSVYRWKGEVNEDQEELLMIKSLQELVPELTQWVKREHPYDDCEVISVPVTGGSSTYLQWVHESVKSAAV